MQLHRGRGGKFGLGFDSVATDSAICSVQNLNARWALNNMETAVIKMTGWERCCIPVSPVSTVKVVQLLHSVAADTLS